MNHAAHTATDTVHATITTASGRITTEVRVVEGEMDSRHLSQIVRDLATDAGDQWPTEAVYVDGCDEPWTLALMDVVSGDSVGSVTIHHGAGA